MSGMRFCWGFIVATRRAPAFAWAQTAGKPFDFFTRGPYRSAVPRPSSIVGFEAGESHSTFRDQERAILAIAAAAKGRVRLIDYGRSVEGRPLRLIAVSSPENIAKLE